MQTIQKYIRTYGKEVECIVIDVPPPDYKKWGNESHDDCYKACRQWLVDNYNYNTYAALNLTQAGFVEDDIVFVKCYSVTFHFSVNFVQGVEQ